MHGEVSTRPARLPDDGDFLLSVYASTRRPELSGLGWTEKQQDTFIGMQFDAQTRQYRESFPDATYSVICVDGERAGRLIVNRAGPTRAPRLGPDPIRNREAPRCGRA